MNCLLETVLLTVLFSAHNLCLVENKIIINTPHIIWRPEPGYSLVLLERFCQHKDTHSKGTFLEHSKGRSEEAGIQAGVRS